MHPSAMMNSEMFFNTYGDYFKNKKEKITVVEIGSQNVNGSIRDKCPPEFSYIGLDFAEGHGVDMILTDPYTIPLQDNSADMVVSSSCFEHAEMFWLVFLEAVRIIKPDGLIFITAPSNGSYHCFPVDCWRFYPEAGKALVTWAKKNGYNAELLESYTSVQDVSESVAWHWNDFVSVFVKDAAHVSKHPKRIIDTFEGFKNGWKQGSTELLNPAVYCEDQRKLTAIAHIIHDQVDVCRHFPKKDDVSIEQHKLSIISRMLTNQIRCL